MAFFGVRGPVQVRDENIPEPLPVRVRGSVKWVSEPDRTGPRQPYRWSLLSGRRGLCQLHLVISPVSEHPLPSQGVGAGDA